MKRFLPIIFLVLLFNTNNSFAARPTGVLELVGRTASRLATIDASLDIVSVANICSWISGDGTFITCGDDGDGTGTIDFVADYSDISSNDAATDVTGTELETLTDTSNADLLHAHTGASLSSIDISDDTNLAVTAPVVLTDDTISYTGTYSDISTNDAATDVTGAELETLTDTSNADALHVHESAGISNLDHGADNTAASLLDDDHTQYFLLTGRTGAVGQTAYFSTDSGGGGELYSTSHATKGNINFFDYIYMLEATSNLSIGTDSPTRDAPVFIAGKTAAGLGYCISADASNLTNTRSFPGEFKLDYASTSLINNQAGVIVGNTDKTNNNYAAILYSATTSTDSYATFGTMSVVFTDHNNSSKDADYAFLLRNNNSLDERARIKNDSRLSLNAGTSPSAMVHAVNTSATYAGMTLKGAASQSAQMLTIEDSAGNDIYQFALATSTNPYTVFNIQKEDIDFVVHSDNITRAFFVDAATDIVGTKTTTRVNEDGGNYDFVVEGDNDTDLIHADADGGTNGRVGISEAAPDSTLEVNGSSSFGDGTNQTKISTGGEMSFGGTGTLILPNGTGLPGTCTQGELFHDTDSDDCADTGGGDGALCICKTTDTWALISNF